MGEIDHADRMPLVREGWNPLIDHGATLRLRIVP
jgi:hypothetical protein